ncbi:hypothetical protein SAMN05216404_1041 [Nitrosospira multiformis]|uniref:Uncharacterized protein n=1 Tax=Nitrosospira multiformis TaxID=1231 RepID=A0A1H8FVG4_9PROT|nr:hypothetical protein SAMN05216404_1041 [Nitrosospira multiformis]
MMLLCLDLQFLPAAVRKYVKPIETDEFPAGIPLAILKLLWRYCIAGLYKPVAPVRGLFLVPLRTLLRGIFSHKASTPSPICFSHTSYRIVDVDILVADAEFFRNVLSQGLHAISLGGVMPG